MKKYYTFWFIFTASFVNLERH